MWCYRSPLTKRRRLPFALLLILSLLGKPLSAQSDAHIGDLLERYGRGDSAGVATALQSIADFRAALRQLDKVAVPWIRSEGPQAMPRRRLVAAGFALEVAYAGMTEWREARDFVEWGCVLLRAGGLPRPAERTWHLAAVALVQGAHDPDFLTSAWPSRSGPKAQEHLRHSAFRFPDEDRLRLARAATDEFRTLGSDPKHPQMSSYEQGREALLRSPDPVTPSEVFDRFTAQQLLSISIAPRLAQRLLTARRSVWLWDLADQWKTLTGRGPIRTEAAIHLANTYLRLARPDLALTVLEAVPPALHDSSLTYLAQYLTGRAAEVKGDRQAAENAYRAALVAAPGAQSATIALATLLFLSDSRDEALELMNGQFSKPELVADPWRDYQAGDFRLWPQRLAELRESYQQ